MNEPVRWVTKADAAEELEVSLSTLDRMIRSEEVEVVREGRRVFVRMEGPEYPSVDELLDRATARGEELERTVQELERNLAESERRASMLARERDAASEAAAASQEPYWNLKWEHKKEIAAHKGTRAARNVLCVIVLVLLVVVGLLTWRLLA